MRLVQGPGRGPAASGSLRRGRDLAGYNTIYKSIDGGTTFTQTTLDVSLYSLKVDPNDPTHLISGLHEADGIVESIDGGASWQRVGGAGFPSGGVSWYPYFVDTGNAAATRRTWFAIAQNGASAVMTTASGASWTMYAWACSNCDLGTPFEIAPQPGNTWSTAGVPTELVIGLNGVVVTSDGTRNVFVGLMWDQGLWRYVEP